MRTNQRATFIKAGVEYYDTDLGDYVANETVSETVPVFVMDLGRERSIRLFGNYEQGRKVVMVRRPLNVGYTNVEIIGERYVISSIGLDGMSFYLERERNANGY